MLQEGVFLYGKCVKRIIERIHKVVKFTNSNNILGALKEMFRYVLQESLEAEMDEALGYGKYNSIEKINDNSRNVYSKKTTKKCIFISIYGCYTLYKIRENK